MNINMEPRVCDGSQHADKVWSAVRGLRSISRLEESGVAPPHTAGDGGGRAGHLRQHFGRAALLVLAALGTAQAADPTWNYAVQASAVVAESPPRITLTWVDDTTQGRNGYQASYTVARKAPGDALWGEPRALSPGETSYTDTDVVVGVAYEYQIARVFRDPAAPEADHSAYGYVVSGINVPFPDRRGKAIVVVEEGVAAALADRIRQFRGDLVGDGWTTVQLNVPATDNPAHVRDLIRAEYSPEAAPAHAVILLGHIPVVKAGRYAPDGHEPRPMPTDSYYGDVDGTWVDADGDGVFDRNVIPSDVEMQVGRVDFADLSGAQTGQSELELLARYLDKDHAYRHGVMRFEARGLIGDRVGIDRGRAPAAAAYRAFSAFYGPDAIATANTEDNGADADRWYSQLQSRAFGWAFGSGGGSFDQVAFLGTQGPYKSVTSVDLAADAKAGFYLLFGSYFVEWAHENNLLRAALAAPNGGLGAAWSGRPSFVLHAMGLGETVGYGVRLTQNNDGLYYSPNNAFRRGVHIAWMGDPTLRLTFPEPPASVSGERQNGTVRLTWQPGPGQGGAARYVVFRATSAEGPYVRLTPNLIGETNFVDAVPLNGATYMVRAVTVEQSPSGTYENPSQGVFWTDAGGPVEPLVQPLSAGTVRLSFPVLFDPAADAELPGPRPAKSPNP